MEAMASLSFHTGKRTLLLFIVLGIICPNTRLNRSPLGVLRRHLYHLKTKKPTERGPGKCPCGGGCMGLLTVL